MNDIRVDLLMNKVLFTLMYYCLFLLVDDFLELLMDNWSIILASKKFLKNLEHFLRPFC